VPWNSEDCPECKKLGDAYEAATVAWFRLQGNLRIAQFSHDEESTRRAAAELERMTQKRDELRAELTRHQEMAHPGNGVRASGR
jgi:hypothetical protein